MGLLDQMLGGVLNQALNGQQAQNGQSQAQQGQAGAPLTDLLGSLFGAGAPGQSPAPGGQASPWLGIALALVQQSGGLPALLGKLQQGGLGAQAASWVSTGDNDTVSPAQLQQALGPELLGQAAAQAGVSHQEAGQGLAQVLPLLIDQMTPAGNVPSNHGDMLSSALAMFGSMASK